MPATVLTMATDTKATDASDSDQYLLLRYFIDRDHNAMERLFNRYAVAAFRVALREMRKPS